MKPKKRYAVVVPHYNVLFDTYDGVSKIVSRHANRKEASKRVRELRRKGNNVVLAILKSPRIKKVKIHRK